MKLVLVKSGLPAAVEADPAINQSEGIHARRGTLANRVPPAFSFMTNHSTSPGLETRQQRFETILSRERFTGLKAILDSLSPDREALYQGVHGSNSYEEFLAKLGYRITLAKQIHVQDCYSRLGPAGGIRAVLPYHDIPTQRSLPTLVNFDSTVTVTPKSGGFFNELLAEFKRQLSAQD